MARACDGGWGVSLLIVVVFVFIIGRVDDVWYEDGVVLINNINEVVGIGAREGDEAGINEGPGVAPVGGVGVLPFEGGALFVWCFMIDVEVRERLSELHQEVAGVGVVICLTTCTTFPFEGCVGNEVSDHRRVVGSLQTVFHCNSPCMRSILAASRLLRQCSR